VCTCDPMYVTSQRIMLLNNVISSLKPNCGILCWLIFQRHSTKYSAILEKWCRITDRCKESLFHRDSPIILGCDLLMSCFVLKLHSVLKPQYFIRRQRLGRWVAGGASCDSFQNVPALKGDVQALIGEPLMQ